MERKCPTCGKMSNSNYCDECGTKTVDINQYQSRNSTNEPDGFIKPWLLVVLTIVTLGIYGFIWVHKTTTLLNQKCPRENQSSPATEVLLSIFILPLFPIYLIIWGYKTGKRIDEYKNRIGSRENDVAKVGLVLMIVGDVLYFIPYAWALTLICYAITFALIQDKINNVLLVNNEGNVYVKHVYMNHNEHPKKTSSILMEDKNDCNDSYRKTDINLSVSQDENASDNIQQLRELKQLYDEGILTEEEFNFKKRQLL